jgi:hypothetical protein
MSQEETCDLLLAYEGDAEAKDDQVETGVRYLRRE